MDNFKEGHQAKLLKENDIFKTCVDELRKEYYDKWCKSNFSDVTNREEIFKLMCNLELVMQRLDSKVFLAEQESITEDK